MDNQQKTDAILKKAKDKINNLISNKLSGKIGITLEVNVTQGAIGSASIINNSKESIDLK